MYVCVLELSPGHNRQTDMESDRGHDLSQQDAPTVALCFAPVSYSSFAFALDCVSYIWFHWKCWIIFSFFLMLDLFLYIYLILWLWNTLKHLHMHRWAVKYATPQVHKSKGCCRVEAGHYHLHTHTQAHTHMHGSNKVRVEQWIVQCMFWMQFLFKKVKRINYLSRWHEWTFFCGHTKWIM